MALTINTTKQRLNAGKMALGFGVHHLRTAATPALPPARHAGGSRACPRAAAFGRSAAAPAGSGETAPPAASASGEHPCLYLHCPVAVLSA